VLIATAAADPSGDQLRASGEKLAKDGRYSEAIAAFKAADKLTPRATNWCLIGLAYTRRELWPQAEIAIERCTRLASAADPLPSWLPALEAQLAARLAAVDVAAVDIAVEPAGVTAELTVSSFAPDETFHARVIHLPFGHQVISATAPGYARADVAIDIADRKPQHVVLKLQSSAAAQPEVASTPPPIIATRPVAVAPVAEVPAPQRVRPVPWIVMGAGAGLAVAGAIVEATWFKTARDQLSSATDKGAYDQWSGTFDTRREVVIGLYAAGAVAVGVGLVMELTGHRADERSVQVSVSPTPGGSLVTVGWSR
jgi:protein-S-isoprenylcysteine O-methyltransferase Ste14